MEDTVCRLVFEASGLRWVYRKHRRSAAEHEKEKADKPQTSAKALELVIWESEEASHL
jgi:hypothetical protein